MTSKKMFFVMIGLVSLTAVLIIGAVVGGDLLLQKQSKKLVSLKLDNQVIEGQQTALSQAKKDLEKYSELAIIAKQIVPQDKDQARATREIVTIAAASGVKISSIGFPASTLGQAVPKATTDSTTTTTPTTPAAPSVSQVKAVSGIEGLYQLDIVVTSDTVTPASYAKLIDFLKRLEQNRRTAQVSQIAITPDSVNRLNLNFTLTITLYIKP